MPDRHALVQSRSTVHRQDRQQQEPARVFTDMLELRVEHVVRVRGRMAQGVRLALVHSALLSRDIDLAGGHRVVQGHGHLAQQCAGRCNPTSIRPKQEHFFVQRFPSQHWHGYGLRNGVRAISHTSTGGRSACFGIGHLT